MSREFFESRYKSIGGKIINLKLKPSLRINTLKTNAKKLIDTLKKRGVSLKKVPYVDNAYYYNSKFSLSSTPEYLSGHFYIQEVASMLPATVLNPNKKDSVLDMCASPGSKTTQMSAQMDNEGLIVALEARRDRINRLRLNLQRLWCKNVISYNLDALDFNPGIKFDKILLDAPCSGNYTQQKDWFERRTLKGILKNSQMQKQLLKKAFSLLKDNGTLVYSTCSLEPEEDEFVIDYALKLGFNIEETGLNIGSEGITKFQGYELDERVKSSRRFWPFLTDTQGFFIAKLIKSNKRKKEQS